MSKRFEFIFNYLSSIGCQDGKIEKYLLEISKNTQAVVATNVSKIVGPSINSLLSFVNSTSNPATSFQSADTAEIENEDAVISIIDHAENQESIPQLADQQPQLEGQKTKSDPIPKI